MQGITEAVRWLYTNLRADGGIWTRDLFLTKKCSTPELHRQFICLSFSSSWSGRRGSNSRPSAWKADALSTELLPQTVSFLFYEWSLWAKMDSNHRRYKPADLQSAPFGHSGIRPYVLSLVAFVFWASCRIRTNDPEITNHVLWPTELKRQCQFSPCIRFWSLDRRLPSRLRMQSYEPFPT